MNHRGVNGTEDMVRGVTTFVLIDVALLSIMAFWGFSALFF